MITLLLWLTLLHVALFGFNVGISPRRYLDASVNVLCIVLGLLLMVTHS